jgi:hypothetical protein
MRYLVPADEPSAPFSGSPNRLRCIARSHRDIWDDHPVFAHPSSNQGDLPGSRTRSKRFPHNLTPSEAHQESRVTLRANSADPGLGFQPSRSMIAGSQIDYYRSGTTIAAAPRFNQAPSIRGDFFVRIRSLSFVVRLSRTKEETPPT